MKGVLSLSTLKQQFQIMSINQASLNYSDEDSSMPPSKPHQRTQSTEGGYSHSEDAESESML